jgi:hypothetical protein
MKTELKPTSNVAAYLNINSLVEFGDAPIEIVKQAIQK